MGFFEKRKWSQRRWSKAPSEAQEGSQPDNPPREEDELDQENQNE